MDEFTECEVCDEMAMGRFCESCSDAYWKGQDEERVAAVQRVEALPILIRYVGMNAVAVSDVIAAIKGEQA